MRSLVVLGRELAEKELLDHGVRHTTSDANQGTSEHKFRATVFVGIIGIRDCA